MVYRTTKRRKSVFRNLPASSVYFSTVGSLRRVKEGKAGYLTAGFAGANKDGPTTTLAPANQSTVVVRFRPQWTKY
jgi:hypothetical protein